MSTLNRRALSESVPRYDLQYGEPLVDPQLLEAWRTKLAAAALRTDPGYPPAAGLLTLRSAICHYLARRRGFTCSPEDVLIVGGTQQAMTLIARTLVDEGDIAVIEEPHYWMVLQTLAAHGARVHSVETDAEGIMTSQLPAQGTKLVFVTPSHQFPLGTVMSLSRRMDLLRRTGEQGSWIVEDDYDGEFRYGARPQPPLRSLDGGERVIYVGTFSKSLFPSLRLGYLVCPPALREDLLGAKRLDDCGSPAIQQTALATFMQTGQFEKRLRKATLELERRRTALIDGLNRWLGSHIRLSESPAGMHLVVWFPGLSFAQLTELTELAEQRGVRLYPVDSCYRHKPPHPGLLMGYASLSCPQLRAATEILGGCLSELI